VLHGRRIACPAVPATFPFDNHVGLGFADKSDDASNTAYERYLIRLSCLNDVSNPKLCVWHVSPQYGVVISHALPPLSVRPFPDKLRISGKGLRLKTGIYFKTFQTVNVLFCMFAKGEQNRNKNDVVTFYLTAKTYQKTSKHRCGDCTRKTTANQKYRIYFDALVYG
jgi:hypothetical protein